MKIPTWQTTYENYCRQDAKAMAVHLELQQVDIHLQQVGMIRDKRIYNSWAIVLLIMYLLHVLIDLYLLTK